LIVLTLSQACYIFIRWNSWRYWREANRRALVAGYLSGLVLFTSTLHLLAFHYLGLLLPEDRTAIFFVPICLMIVGAVASFPYSDLFSRAMRRATVLILIVGCAFFVSCLRLHYFLLWRYDADVETVYRQLVQIVGRGHNVRVPAGYLYGSALDYYREYFHDNSFTSFSLWDSPEHAPATHFPPYPLDSSVYVLTFPQDEAFAAHQRLRIIFRGPTSHVVIAVR
jgi:hypothetical protein